MKELHWKCGNSSWGNIWYRVGRELWCPNRPCAPNMGCNIEVSHTDLWLWKNLWQTYNSNSLSMEKAAILMFCLPQRDPLIHCPGKLLPSRGLVGIFFPLCLLWWRKQFFFLSLEVSGLWPPSAHGAVQGQLLGEEGVKAKDTRRMALESIIANIFEGHWRLLLLCLV